MPASTSCRHSAQDVTHHPPDLSEEELKSLVAEIKDYQITHGSLIKAVRHEQPHTVPAIPIGVSLFPTPFPRSSFLKACSLQVLFNKLYARVAEDKTWLYETLKHVIEADAFVKSLWEIYCQVRDELLVQPIALGIFRSDYMLHGDSVAEADIKQVEMNTHSVAGGTHANTVANMHRYLRRRGFYDFLCPGAGAACQAAPDNDTIAGIVDSLAHAHALYVAARSNPGRRLCLLMTVQPFNVNVADERPLEHTLWERHGIALFRVEFGDDVLRKTTMTDTRELLFYRQGTPSTDAPVGRDEQPWEVSLVYHRAGYEPHEYGAAGREARLRIEQSRAIKCPSIAGHLTTLKHVQRALCEPRSLRRFLDDGEATLVESTFMPMYDLRDGSSGRDLAQKLITGTGSDDHVLKPCLEGGGHNVFGEDIADTLQKDENKDWVKFVLMERIRPPSIEGLLISPLNVYDGEVVSELGIFGACIWRSNPDHNESHGVEVMFNEQIGWSLKTKSSDVNEMSVIKGYGCFDSPLLFDS